jgi:hypothetical protein
VSKHAKKKFNLLGHMASQKFAGLIICVIVLGIVAFFMAPGNFGNLALAITGLYTAFVGGRAWSDGQSLKFGGGVGQGDREEVSVVRRVAVQQQSESETEVAEKEID